MIDQDLQDRLHATMDAITSAFDTVDSNGNRTTVQKALNNISDSLDGIATAIFPFRGGMIGADDATGGHVCSLVESVMGVSAGLVKIAEAIETLADAVADSNRNK